MGPFREPWRSCVQKISAARSPKSRSWWANSWELTCWSSPLVWTCWASPRLLHSPLLLASPPWSMPLAMFLVPTSTLLSQWPSWRLAAALTSLLPRLACMPAFRLPVALPQLWHTPSSTRAPRLHWALWVSAPGLAFLWPRLSIPSFFASWCFAWLCLSAQRPLICLALPLAPAWPLVDLPLVASPVAPWTLQCRDLAAKSLYWSKLVLVHVSPITCNPVNPRDAWDLQ